MTGLEQIGIAAFGLTALWMAMGRDEKLRRWAPIVGLAGQPFWALFALKTAGWGLGILVVAYSAVYLRGAFVQLWGPWLRAQILAWAQGRHPDFVIGGQDNPYLRRHWLLPRNRFFNVYVHEFLRSDDDRALHCHPWANCSILLAGQYTEHTIAAGGVHRREILKAGDWRIRWSGRMAHRVELHDGPCWTVFITGPRYREWGFHCERGWVHWQVFTAPDDKGAIGRGCEG